MMEAFLGATASRHAVRTSESEAVAAAEEDVFEEEDIVVHVAEKKFGVASVEKLGVGPVRSARCAVARQ